MPEPVPEPLPGATRRSRRPGSSPRRVVAAPTGAPGEAEEAGSLHLQAPPGPGSAADDAAWEAEAERLRRDRPPHWG